MAIALSRSLVETKTGSEASQEEQTIGVNTKKTLAEFGFKSKSSLNNDYSSLMEFDGKVPKWMKKCTRLTRRNPEIQKKLMEEKVQILLDEEFLEHPYYEKTDRNYKVTSILLRQYYSKENKTFFKNSLEQKSSIIFDSYYVNDLVQKSTTAVGCLLKDWSKIPGRDLSPERLDIDLVFFPTQKLHTENSQKEENQEIAIQETVCPEINNEEEEDSYLFSEESETEIEEEVKNRDDEKITSAKSECSENNAKNMEIEKTPLNLELIEISSEESVNVEANNNTESPEKMELELEHVIVEDSPVDDKISNSIEEIISPIEPESTSSSSRIVIGIENSPEKMEFEFEEKEKSIELIRVQSPDMFSDLEDECSPETSPSKSMVLNENLDENNEDQSEF